MRDRILQEATRLFAVRGYDGTSLKEIADSVGIRKPSLLYHFPSKEELREAVLDQLLARWSDVLPAILTAAARDRRFDAVMEEMVSFFRADPNRARLLTREVLDRPEDITRRLAEHVVPWFDVVVRDIERGKEQGYIHPDVDPEAYIFQVINLGVVGLAMSDNLQLVLPRSTGAAESHRRLGAEMMRVARAALFLPGTDTAKVAGEQARSEDDETVAAKTTR